MTPIKYLVITSLASLAACAAQPAAQTSAQAGPATPPAADATPAVSPTEPPVASAENVTIAFPTGSATLTREAGQQLDGAARLYRSASPEVMIVAGHADPAGPELPNVILSAHRAQAVKQGLVARGVPATRLQIVADGEAAVTPGYNPTPSAVITWR